MKTKPIVSKDFTIDDIHKIREWHYEQRQEMGVEEYAKKLSQRVQSILADFPNAKIVTLSQETIDENYSGECFRTELTNPVEPVGEEKW